MKQRPSSANTSSVVLALTVAIACGALIAIQGNLNGSFASEGGGPLLAGWVSYVGTLVTTILIVIVTGQVSSILATLKDRGAWWWFAIGIGGVPIVLTIAWGVPLVGVTITSVCSIAGQTITSLILDSRGVGVPARIGLSPRRIAAAVVAFVGLGLAISAGIGGVSNIWAMVAVGIAVFLSGGLLSVQSAGNGEIVARSGNPLMATLTSVAGGTLIMTVLLGGIWAFGGLEGTSFPPLAHWWVYGGGPTGTGIVLCSAWAIRKLGTFRMTLAIIAGQMVTSMIIDVITGTGVTPSTIAAVVTMVIATLLVVSRKSEPTS